MKDAKPADKVRTKRIYEHLSSIIGENASHRFIDHSRHGFISDIHKDEIPEYLNAIAGHGWTVRAMAIAPDNSYSMVLIDLKGATQTKRRPAEKKDPGTL